MLIKFDNEKEWLKAKNKDVTSTEVAALFGLDQYKSRLKLWHIKANTINDDFEESPFSLWGKRLQIPVGMGICEDEGWEGFDLTGYYLHDEKINSGASLDMKAICKEKGNINLEIKVAEALTEENGWFKNAAPIHYEFQLQRQMHEAAKHGDPFDCSCLGTLAQRQSTRLYFREYDKELGFMIDEEIEKFWQSIKDNNPPPPDYSVDDELLKRLAKPVRMGETKNLSLDNRAVELVHKYKKNQEKIAEINAKINPIIAENNAIKTELYNKIGNAETVIIGDFILSAKSQYNKEKFIPAYEFRRFDLKKRKK